MSEASEIAMMALQGMIRELEGAMDKAERVATQAVRLSEYETVRAFTEEHVESAIVHLEVALKQCHQWLALKQAMSILDDSSHVDEIAALEPELCPATEREGAS